MSKLHLIRLHPEDEVEGNYRLMLSGPVTHMPNPHRYLISEEQLQALNENGIRYSHFKEKGE